MKPISQSTREYLLSEAALLWDAPTCGVVADALEALAPSISDEAVEGYMRAGGVVRVVQILAGELARAAAPRMHRVSSTPIWSNKVMDRRMELSVRGPVSAGDVAGAWLQMAGVLVEASCQGGAR